MLFNIRQSIYGTLSVFLNGLFWLIEHNRWEKKIQLPLLSPISFIFFRNCTSLSIINPLMVELVGPPSGCCQVETLL